MKLKAWWWVAACVGSSACSAHGSAPGGASDASALVDGGAADLDGDAESPDPGGPTFGLTVHVPCADSDVQLTDVADVPYGVSATWRLPSGETHVRKVAIASTPRDAHRPVTFCFDMDNARFGVGESIGFLTGDAFYHLANVQAGASCVDALVAGGLTTTHGDKTVCDSGM